jgi:hypothetical protein
MKAAGLPLKAPKIRDRLDKLSYYVNSLGAFAPSPAPDQRRLVSRARKECDAIVEAARDYEEEI